MVRWVGFSNFLEMVKANYRYAVAASLLDLIHTVWEEGKVPRDWSKAILIPIPKRATSANVATGKVSNL